MGGLVAVLMRGSVSGITRGHHVHVDDGAGPGQPRRKTRSLRAIDKTTRRVYCYAASHIGSFSAPLPACVAAPPARTTAQTFLLISASRFSYKPSNLAPSPPSNPFRHLLSSISPSFLSIYFSSSLCCLLILSIPSSILSPT